MKTSSLPNLNRETTPFPNFTSYQDPNHHDDTTLDKRPNIDHSVDTEASETSPFKDILSLYISLSVCIYLFLFVLHCGLWGGNHVNLYCITTSFPNFFPLLGQPDYHDTTTLNKCQKVYHSEDTEASETSPFKDDIHYPVGGSFYEWDQMDQTLPRRPPSPNESVGSNQFSGNVGARSEGPNFTQFRRDRGNLDFPEDEFRRAFKMCKSTFNLICTQPESIVDDKDMMLQLALPFTPAISQRVAVCIWYLATGEPLRLVSKRFGLDVSSCHEFLLDVCYAIENVLLSQYVNWPDDEEKIKVIKSEFESLCGIPNVGGSMYTIRVPVGAPELNGHAYYNRRRAERTRKTSYTVAVEGVVDSKGIFTYLCIGKLDSITDDKYLEKYEIRANQSLPKGVWIVGNSGYSLTDWELVPYPKQNLSAQVVFNDEFEMVAKKAFGQLKGRWRCLLEITEVKLQELAAVLGACCVLHNICEMSNEAMDPADAIRDIFDEKIVPENRVRSDSAM